MNLDQFTDQYGNLIADGTRNKIGLDSSYRYTPERWRVFYNGSRRFIRYGDNSNFTDNIDYYTLSPASGDTMTMRTAEIFRYVPQFSVKPSFAFALNQPLQSGDKLTISFGEADLNNLMTAADGWILEFLPSLETNQCYFSAYRSGSVATNGGSKKRVDMRADVSAHSRGEMEINWYNVGADVFRETYTENGHQENINQCFISADGQRGPTSGNQPIEFSFTSGGNGTELQVGSVGAVILGSPDQKIRSKRDDPTLTLGTGDGSFYPLYAIKNNERGVKVTLADLDPLRFGANSDLTMILQTFDSGKVNFGGGDSWSAPGNTDPFETATRTRTDISSVADLDGTIGGSNGVGGTQKLKAKLLQGGQGSGAQTRSLDADNLKDILYYGDIGVIMGASGAAADIESIIDFEEEW